VAGAKTASTSITQWTAATLTKTEVRAKLAELHDELNDGVVTNAAYTVA
jgi:hypothetical protein